MTWGVISARYTGDVDSQGLQLLPDSRRAVPAPVVVKAQRSWSSESAGRAGQQAQALLEVLPSFTKVVAQRVYVRRRVSLVPTRPEKFTTFAIADGSA